MVVVEADWYDQVAARDGTFACCVQAANDGDIGEVDHWLTMHRPLLGGRMVDPDTVCWTTTIDDDDDEDSTEFLEMVGACGHIFAAQPAALHNWYDAWLKTPGGHQRPIRIHSETNPVTIVPDEPTAIREYLLSVDYDDLSSGPMCFLARRPDPLFRLPGRQLPFDERWSVPTAGLAIFTIGPSAQSDGWGDLAEAQNLCQLVQAVGSEEAVIGALTHAAQRAESWGAVALIRGGGPGWQHIFDAPEVVDAVRTVQRAGLPVLSGLGHVKDVTVVERVADFAWETPSALGAALRGWAKYLSAEASESVDSMSAGTYSAGQALRANFDRAWARHRPASACPRLEAVGS